MNGVHDLGGTDGLGPIDPKDDEPAFRSDWEKAVFTMLPATLARGFYNLDQIRFGLEQMPPGDYLTSRYFEHWLYTIESNCIRTGVIDPDELDQRTRHYRLNPDAALPEGGDAAVATLVETVCRMGASARREIEGAPRFSVGTRVRVAADHPYGHTRRARYIRGKTGVIDLVHDAFVYPDAAGNGLGEDPAFVYTVRFDAAELWGPETAAPNSSVCFDVWEPYIQAV
ncbi:nitrile hydratase subunit beta (plasmid) [Pseudonocardia bannensis]|uniref:Nitrile hydratase subunit beta n=1 Tax=Pseudonocardia bannensis TaxID=630973 RepID=A0A848DR61_9PSEU|nr:MULTISPECIES: nitrile hydratase subunit beta [Pseudonocardia]NMH94989.1 nitrile hydratase subunit beta [Pseudonocardia bannensis]